MLELKKIRKSYEGIEVLKNINLKIEKGEIVSILGPSGCGKTTLLNLILGLTQVSEGRIIFDGEDITQMPMEKRGFNIVFQDYALFPNLNVYENIVYGLKNKPNISTTKEVQDLINLLGLGKHLTKKIEELSGGQKQRTALARTLVMKPKILLLDEPLSALDGVIKESIKQKIKEIARDFKLTTIIVTHDPEEALTLSDDRIEKAVRQNRVRLVIIDPVQAFIGADVDMNRANEVRPVFRKLGMIAEKTGCAIVLIGHLNKSSGTQSTYRGLGSIDIMAAVRSLIFIGKVRKDPTTRVLIHEKSSLAPPGETMAFKLGDEEGFRWVGAYEISADDLLDGKEGKPTETKLQRGTKLIYELLADGNAVTIRELDEKAKAQGISQRTMREARSRMKEELDYRMNEKQENTIRLKKQGRMGDGRILE